MILLKNKMFQMNRYLTILTVCIFTFLANITTAQTSFAENNLSLSLISENDATNNNWAFSSIDQKYVYYIDFESVNIHLSDIVVKNDEGEVVFRDDVSTLPEDAIYEIDLSPYGSGKYNIELRSFTKILKKEIQID